MAGEWTTIRLGDVCSKIGSGATPRGGSGVYLDSGEVALIRSQNVHNDSFRRDGLAFIAPHHAKELENVEVMCGDVLLNITGDSVARSCQVDDSILPARVNQHVAIIRPDPKRLDPRYLRYCLVSPNIQARMLSWAGSGGTRNALTKGMIESFEILAPEKVGEQHAIAGILGALDDKVELNRRMNETLEAIAQAIFKSWFVDFDPVRARMAGRQPYGMDAATAALFPDRLVLSERGGIPEGWEAKSLPDVIEVNPSRRLPKGQESPYVEMANLPVSSARVADWEQREFTSGTKFADGDVLLARITPCLENGKTAYVDFLEDDQVGWGSTEYIILRSRPPLPTEFAYLLARSDNFRSHAIQNMTGTSGRQRVPVSCFDRYQVCVPPQDIAERLGLTTSVLFAVLKARDDESRTLAAIRDALLPKLLSAHIRVKEAERFLKDRGL